jgi:hypothetical protein
MKEINDKAFVMSVLPDVSPEVLRINLRWRGNHEITDFDLAGLGKVLHTQAETENAGWVVIKHFRFVKSGDEVPLQGKTDSTESLGQADATSTHGLKLFAD